MLISATSLEIAFISGYQLLWLLLFGCLLLLIGCILSIWRQKWDLEHNVQKRTAELQRLSNQQRALFEVVNRIRSSLDLGTVFQVATVEVRQLLGVDRVGIFRFYPASSLSDGEFVSESVLPPFDSVLKCPMRDHCFGEQYAPYYQQGQIQAVSDIQAAELAECHVAVLSQFQIRANLVIPLLKGTELWGLLCIHQCSGPHQWQDWEIEFASQIAAQLSIAIHQAELLHQTQQRTSELAKVNAALQRQVSDYRQAQQRLVLLIQRTPLAVIEWDEDFRIIAWNPAAERMFGYGKQEAMDRNPADLIVPEPMRNRTKQLMSVIFAQRGGTRSTSENLTKDGNTIVCEWYNTPLIDEDGNVIGVASMALDITERIQAEHAVRQQTERLEQTLHELQRTQAHLIQSEKMSSLGQLVAGIAHEINNPVNFIYGNITYINSYTHDLLELLQLYQEHYPDADETIQQQVEMLDLEFVAQDLPKLLSSMKVGADRIREIVLSLRNFSRLDQAEVKPVNVHEGIDSTLLILQHRFKTTASRPAIEVVKEYGDLPIVECFAGQLNQVFMNLLANAIDALHETQYAQSHWSSGPILGTIIIRTQRLGSDWIQISIKDNGPGITEAARPKLFDPFFTTKAVGKGTGLGLSISYQIIEKHGGRLRCISQPGQGAEFVIEIPIQQTTVSRNRNLKLA